MSSAGICRDAHIVLTGPMGSGKTTVGLRLARRLSRPFYDSDAQIEGRYGTSARLLAEEHGVDWLHDAEAEALAEALAEEIPSVVAAAASIGDLRRLDRFLGGGAVTVLLDGDVEVLDARAKEGRHRRSVSLDEYRALTERRRRSLGRHVALTIDVTSLPAAAVVEAILQYCRRDSTAVGEEADGGE